MEVIKVGMADLKVLCSTGILTTIGLGSCVGIALHDKTRKIGGLAHIMLPSSKSIRNNENAAKFADTAVLSLLATMLKRGAHKETITAKIAGGAQMFSFSGKNSDLLRIGERNIQSTLAALKDLSIPLIAQDVGGNYGRTVELDIESGIMTIKTIGHGILYM